MTLLQKACDYGLHEFAALLLDRGADPNKRMEECGTAPILFAAYHGHYELIELLINHKISSIESVKTTDFSVIDRTTNESVLHWVLKVSQIQSISGQLRSVPVTSGQFRSVPVSSSHFWSLLAIFGHFLSPPVTSGHVQSLPVTFGLTSSHFWSLLVTSGHF